MAKLMADAINQVVGKLNIPVELPRRVKPGGVEESPPDIYYWGEAGHTNGSPPDGEGDDGRRRSVRSRIFHKIRSRTGE